MGAVTDTLAKGYNDCFNQVKNYEYLENYTWNGKVE